MTKAKKKAVKHTTIHGNENTIIKGVLEITRGGFGYVVIPNNFGDVIVQSNQFNTALDGDTVLVKITKENIKTGRKEGTITEVVERRQTEFIGQLQVSAKHAFFIPDNKKPIPDFYIPLAKIGEAQDKQRVIVKLVQWNKDDKSPVGEVVGILRQEDEGSRAFDEILVEEGFSLNFSNEVIAETEKLSEIINEDEIAKRLDCREILTITIDPVDAKDFDDAISIKKINNDLYEIGVHIADVSHYVLPHTQLDDEAYKRATSMYLPGRVNPMLPEKISNELCSLRPNEDKLTFSAIFQITKNAVVKQTHFAKTIIHSNRRYTYEEIQDIIEQKNEDDQFNDEVLLLNKISQTLREQRFAKGAINFSSKEVRFVLDEKGKPIGITIKESKEAHQLIEELMLLANKAVAQYVGNVKYKGADIPFPYRVHDTPDEAKLEPFIAFARKYGHKFDISSPEKIAESFNQLLADAKGKPEQQVLETLGIRTMAKAAYTTKNIGHYGLAFEHYAHFTSPIRRYPDVLVHRVLQNVLTKNILIDEKMEEKCQHCSTMERSAMDAERAGNKYKQVEYMQDKVGQVFDAVITGVAGFGFFAETIEHKCEGLVSIVQLSDYDNFRLVESDYALVGKRSGRKFRMGDEVKVLVVSANLTKRQIDYEWVLQSTAKKRKNNEA